ITSIRTNASFFNILSPPLLLLFWESSASVWRADYPMTSIGVNATYCAVYNLTERRFVAPFENLTLLGLMMGRRGRERNGGIGYAATIQAGLFAIDSQALPPGATSREERDVGRIR